MTLGNDFPKLSIRTQALIDHVNELLVRARRQRKEDLGAVNWGDLGVRDVEYRLSMMRPDCGPSCVVLIEEADSLKLAAWIAARLDPSKFMDAPENAGCIEIVTEW